MAGDDGAITLDGVLRAILAHLDGRADAEAMLRDVLSRIDGQGQALDAYRQTLDANTAAKLANAAAIESLAADITSVLELYRHGNDMIADAVGRADADRIWHRRQALRSYRVEIVVSACSAATFALVLIAVLLGRHVVPEWSIWVALGLICAMVLAALWKLRGVMAAP